MSTKAAYILHNETNAAQVLRAHLAEILGDADDEDNAEIIHDTIEGETNVEKAIEWAIEQVQADMALLDGLKKAIQNMTDRKGRFEKRIENMRVAICNAMAIAEISSLETPLARITRKSLPPKALIVEEADIPAKYWVPADPKLDKRAVLADLKAEVEVPGAQLSNGGETAQIKWS